MKMKTEISTNNAYVFLSSVFIAVFGFLVTIILARLLGPTGFGLYSFALVITSVFMIFSSWGTTASVVRFVSFYVKKRKHEEAGYVIKTGFKYRSIISVIIGGAVFLFSREIAAYVFSKPETFPVIMVSGLLIITDSLSDLLLGIFIGLKKFNIVFIYRIFDKIAKSGLAILLVFMGLSYMGAVYGLLVGSIILYAFMLILIKKHKGVLKSVIKKTKENVFVTFGLWSFISGLSVMTFYYIDSFMISIMLDVKDIGFYRIASVWSLSLVSFFPVQSVVLFSYFSSLEKKISLKILYNSLRYLFILILPLSFLLLSNSFNIITFFYKDVFIKSAYPLMILSFISIPFIISQICFTYFQGINKPKVSIKITWGATILNIILNYVFIPLFGITGAAVASLISRILESFVMLLYILGRKIKGLFFVIYKPAIASLIIFIVSKALAINTIFELFLYNIFYLAVYAGIMFAIKGITKDDVELIKNILAKK